MGGLAGRTDRQSESDEEKRRSKGERGKGKKERDRKGKQKRGKETDVMKEGIEKLRENEEGRKTSKETGKEAELVRLVDPCSLLNRISFS